MATVVLYTEKLTTIKLAFLGTRISACGTAPTIHIPRCFHYQMYGSEELAHAQPSWHNLHHVHLCSIVLHSGWGRLVCTGQQFREHSAGEDASSGNAGLVQLIEVKQPAGQQPSAGRSLGGHLGLGLFR